MTAWKPGMLAVCVDAEWHDVVASAKPCPLKENEIYTVVGLSVAAPGNIYRGESGHVCLILREVTNPYPDNGFAAVRFRPIVSENKHIAAFKQMLKNSERKNKAELQVSLAAKSKERA